MLPIIKGSKATLEDSPTTSTKLMGHKAKDKFNDLLLSEQLLNKSAVTNVLKISRMNRNQTERQIWKLMIMRLYVI